MSLEENPYLYMNLFLNHSCIPQYIFQKIKFQDIESRFVGVGGLRGWKGLLRSYCFLMKELKLIPSPGCKYQKYLRWAQGIPAHSCVTLAALHAVALLPEPYEVEFNPGHCDGIRVLPPVDPAVIAYPLSVMYYRPPRGQLDMYEKFLIGQPQSSILRETLRGDRTYRRELLMLGKSAEQEPVVLDAAEDMLPALYAFPRYIARYMSLLMWVTNTKLATADENARGTQPVELSTEQEGEGGGEPYHSRLRLILAQLNQMYIREFGKCCLSSRAIDAFQELCIIGMENNDFSLHDFTYFQDDEEYLTGKTRNVTELSRDRLRFWA